MHRLALLIGLVVGLATAMPHATTAQQAGMCFPETGYCMDGAFKEYWQRYGGLPVFGFPIAPATQDADGTVFQYLERTVFEYTPQNRPPYNVSLYRMGDLILKDRGYDWQSKPGETEHYRNCVYFEQTHYNVCNYDGGSGFAQYWQTHGLEFDGKRGFSYNESLALFGFPLTEDYQDVDEQGNAIIVQWFERARFEYHPNNLAGSKILLGLLGREYANNHPSN